MNAALDFDLTGHRISQYAVVNLIGAGGMGKVYLARDERLRRHVAVKVLSGPQTPTRAPGTLLAEARLLSQFTHRYVAAIYDFVKFAHREFIVMEFVPGATLKDVVAAGPLAPEDVIRLGIQLARGIAAAHGARILHRDLKPQNVKVTPRGRLKILDFGVAAAIAFPRLTDSDLDTSSSIRAGGTAPYMSPEQLRGESLDERSDIFSAGAVLYEMATGRAAFPQRHLAQLVDAIQREEPAPPSTVNPFVPPALERIVMKALRKNAACRHPRATTLAAELQALRFTPKLVATRRRVAHRHDLLAIR